MHRGHIHGPSCDGVIVRRSDLRHGDLHNESGPVESIFEKETVTDEEWVAEQVHKEQIEIHDEDRTVGRHERRRRG